MGKVTLATGSIVGYAYGMEFFIAWYSGNPYERFVFMRNRRDPSSWAAVGRGLALLVGLLVHDYLQRHLSRSSSGSRRSGRNMVIVFIISIFVNIGMWFERFVIIVTSLHRDFIPSNWAYFRPDLGGYPDSSSARSGLFLTLFLLFMRFLPMIAIAEVKGVTPQADPHHPLGGAKHGGHH